MLVDGVGGVVGGDAVCSLVVGGVSGVVDDGRIVAFFHVFNCFLVFFVVF